MKTWIKVAVGALFVAGAVAVIGDHAQALDLASRFIGGGGGRG